MTGRAGGPASIPRATLIAIVILIASGLVSFGFVVQRGGLLLPEAPSPAPGQSAAPSGPGSTTTAIGPSTALGASASEAAAGAGSTPSFQPIATPSVGPSAPNPTAAVQPTS